MQVIIAMVLLYEFLGWAVFAGLGVVIILVPLNTLVAGYVLH